MNVATLIPVICGSSLLSTALSNKAIDGGHILSGLPLMCGLTSEQLNMVFAEQLVFVWRQALPSASSARGGMRFIARGPI